MIEVGIGVVIVVAAVGAGLAAWRRPLALAGRRAAVGLAVVLLAVGCAPAPPISAPPTAGLVSATIPAPTATPTPSPEPSPSTTPGVGLIARGYVRRGDGSGLEGVAIYRRFASYPGEVIATTGQDGYYEAGPIYIPGDEMVSVWAALEGYLFEPMYYDWRHYYGLETRRLDFVAIPVAPASESEGYCPPCQR